MIGNAIAGLYGVGVTPSTTAYESIQTITVGSGGAADVTFSSIPSTYTHLQVRINMLNTSGYLNNVNYYLNGDTANNYSNHWLFGNGTTTGSGGGASTTAWLAKQGDTTYPSVAIIDILDYKNTNKYTTVKSLNGSDANGSGLVFFWSSVWLNTAAVNSIKFTPAQSFAQNAHFALYGIKGA